MKLGRKATTSAMMTAISVAIAETQSALIVIIGLKKVIDNKNQICSTP